MLNEAYQGNWQQARELLDEQGYVLLAQILDEETYQQLTTQVEELTYSEEYEPHLHHYDKALVPQHAHEILEAVAKNLELAIPKRTQLRKYKKGSYTLQDDDNATAGYEYTLFIAKDWDAQWRGEHTYVHPEKDPIHAPAQPNALLIVKRDEETKKFVKRINHHAKDTYTAIQAQAS